MTHDFLGTSLLKTKNNVVNLADLLNVEYLE